MIKLASENAHAAIEPKVYSSWSLSTNSRASRPRNDISAYGRFVSGAMRRHSLVISKESLATSCHQKMASAVTMRILIRQQRRFVDSYDANNIKRQPKQWLGHALLGGAC